MDLKLALTGTPAAHFLQIAIVFVALKVMATVMLLMILRGNYRELPDTPFVRTVYLVGKGTPALAVGFACVAAVLEHHRAEGWLLGCVCVLTSASAIYVTRLRSQGRFFGVLDLLSHKRRQNSN